MFKKYREMYWPKPSYVLIGRNLSAEKSAPWIELFLDLSFVIAIGIMSQALLANNRDMTGLIGFSFAFMLLFLIWRSSTFYNQVFYSNTVKNRLIVFGHILCALMLVLFTEVSPQFFEESYMTFALPYMLTAFFVEMYLGFIWWSSWRSLYRITKQNDTYSLRGLFWGVVNTGAGLGILLITLINYFTSAHPERWAVISFGIIITIQLFAGLFLPHFNRYMLERNAKKHQAKSVFLANNIDAGHTMERFGLFMLLMIGEMFLGIVVAMKTPGVMNLSNFITFILLVCIVAGVFWIYFDQVLSYTFKPQYIAAWTVAQFFISLNLLFMATFNREVLINFEGYFYSIHLSYIVFFLFLLLINFFIDHSEESGRLEMSVDLTEQTKALTILRVITVVVLIIMLFTPITNSLLYTFIIFAIFLTHVVTGLYTYLKGYDNKQKLKNNLQ